MFLQRQDDIDAIDNLFVHDEDGRIHFRPRGQTHALLVSEERYLGVMDAVIARHRRAMLATWISGFILGVGAIWVVIARGDYLLALALLALNFVWALWHHFMQHQAVLGPLMAEWRESRRILSEP